MAGVEKFFEEDVELKRKPRGTNSSIAPSNNHTSQIDKPFISENDLEASQEFRAGLVAIDVSSKFAVVMPMKAKDGSDVIEGTKRH